jgi:hypothetical protein
MREYSWYAAENEKEKEKDLVDEAYEELENVLATKPEAKRPYASIFSPKENPGQVLRLVQKLYMFLKMGDGLRHLETQSLGL